MHFNSFKFEISFTLVMFTFFACLNSILSNVVVPSNLNTISPLTRFNQNGKEVEPRFVINARVVHPPNTTTSNLSNHNSSNTANNAPDNGAHSSNQNIDSNGHESGSDGGEHHVSPPSYQLFSNAYHYKPDNFKMFSKQVAIKQVMVGFTYSADSHYDRYIFQIRYHGYESYITNKLKLNRSETNHILLKEFLDAQYIICVTLFSSSGLPEYEPISTSDMCIDVTIGESHTPGGHHSTTGYLTPLLVVVAAVLLGIIAIGDYIIHSCSKDHTKPHAQKKMSIQKPKSIENGSDNNLNKLNGNNNLQQYTNKAFSSELNSNIQKFRKQNIEIKYENKSLTGSETLNHVLDDKPWISNQQKSLYS